jgi:hypothetical protein
MKKLIQERIIKTEVQTLTDTDRSTLVNKRDKQLKFLLISYVPLALILAYVFIDGLEVIYREKFPYAKHEINEEDVKNFDIAAPYVCGGFLLLLTGFFIRIFLQTTAPLIKDIKKNKKHLLSVNPEKTDMSAFNKYYITTPVFKKQQLAISRDTFSMISNTEPLILELAPNSLEILRIKSNGNEIECT